MIYTAYFSRMWGSIDGFFTIQLYDSKREKLTKLFNRLPARSGQRAFAKTQWVRAKSPIPKGRFFLWMNCTNRGVFPTGRGIGEFHSISSGLSNQAVLAGPNGQLRTEIGLHPENDIPGTAGCIGLLYNTSQRKAEVGRLFAFMEQYGKETGPFIDLVVL